MKFKNLLHFATLVTVASACHFGKDQQTRLLENAAAESSSQVLRITGVGVDPSEVSYAYLTGPAGNRRIYGLSCPHEDFGEDTKGRKALIKALGFDIDNETPSLVDGNNADQKKLLDKWKYGEQPTLKCRYDTGSVNLRMVVYPAPVNETKFFISFPERRTSAGTPIMYNLGCEGLISGLGLAKDKALPLSYDSLKIDYEFSDAYDISCVSGKSPSGTTSFVNACSLAKSSGDAAQWKTYRRLIEIAGYSETSLTACADTEAKVKTLTRLDLSRSGLSDLVPLAYFTSLTELDLSYNAFTDFAPLKNLAQLKVLKLDANALGKVADLGKVLRELKFLDSLSLRENNLQNIDGLGEIQSILNLDLGNNPALSSISAISALTRLKTLKLDSTKVLDLSPLEAMTDLSSLDMSNNTGLTFKSFEVLKNTKVQYPILGGTPLLWSSASQTFFTNCMFLHKIPNEQQALIKSELETLGATFDADGKNQVPCQNLEKEKQISWTLEPSTDLGSEGGKASDGICNGREKCIYIDRNGLFWKGWDGVARSYNEAESYCQTLVYGGFDDWRMPSKEELLSASKARISKLQSSQFKVIGSWSVTDAVGHPDRSQFVLFRSGGQIVNASKSSKLPYLTCVR